MPPSPDSPLTSSEKPLDPNALKLDALKAIRESAFARWDKRRSYEWQLSISIWTAVAAFCALILNKDFPLKTSPSSPWCIATVGTLIITFHGIYLWKMFENTIGDAHIQRWAEKEMYKLAFDAEIPRCEEGFPLHPLYPKLSKYGIVQVFITLVLVVGALAAVISDRNPQSQDQNTHDLKK